jgi:type IV pilus assembly protein PilC
MPIQPIKNVKIQKHASIWHMNISDVIFRNRKKRVPVGELALFCRNLSYLLGAGLPVKTALLNLRGKSLGPTLKTVLPHVHKRVMKGDSFSHALKMEEVFPEFMVGYMAVGEKTAQLANVCQKLAHYYEQQSKTRRELFAALIYPAAVLLMMFGVIALAMVSVLPGYARIFAASNVQLPPATEFLLNVSAFLSGNIVLLAWVFGAAVIVLIIFLQTGRGQKLLSHAQLKVPLLRQAVNLHFTQSLSLLLTSGIRLSDAVFLCMDLIQNTLVKKDLNKLSKNLYNGLSFSEALENITYLHPLMRDLARVGEKTGDLSQVMERCVEYFASDYTHNITRVKKLIEPTITIVMGVLIGLVMLAVVLPTFQLASVM